MTLNDIMNAHFGYTEDNPTNRQFFCDTINEFVRAGKQGAYINAFCFFTVSFKVPDKEISPDDLASCAGAQWDTPIGSKAVPYGGTTWNDTPTPCEGRI